MRIKVKTPSATDVITIDDESITVAELVSHISRSSSKLGGTAIASFKVGFPPQTVDAASTIPIKEAGIRANQQILAETGPSSGLQEESTEIPSFYVKELDKYAILRNVPDDNSCMFRAISYSLTNQLSMDGINLRQIVSDTIAGDPFTYNEMVLGRPIDKYCEWIQKKDSWGGAIELGIIAGSLGIRINCFDVETGNLMVFQDEAAKPSKFICLVYSGIHYDSIVLNGILSSNKQADVGNWSSQEDLIVSASKSLVKLLQSRNYSTNTTTFRVRCLECYSVLVGENGASKHANETGHFSFGEVK
ncbi:uncharacterized protein CXQ87_000426 [Candidozyma duobushaemuli]|uniref:Ubiquitin thioesterase OTU n=1 Tax=Candidozyma duobushaemuli TaxID=1231522 RepID=A0A2V1AGU7_9ASCO|nr:uncharacterized protein CXQ87_000426 [[Candida] duobushaemulonis]PVH17537.1 hypothetical protein CXQ87_000426 [[Candida] duobushaemulonis]